MLYMVTFTINIPQMLAYIPYMDPMGYGWETLSSSLAPYMAKWGLVAPKRIWSQTAWGCQDSNVILLTPLFYTIGAIYSRLIFIQTGEA